MSVGENSRNGEFDRVKHERGRFLEEVNDIKMKRDKIERSLIKKNVAMEAMIWALVY